MPEQKKAQEGMVSVELSDDERTAASVILNITLRDCEPKVEPFTGKRLNESGLRPEFAKKLNAVFVQLAGRDHDIYEKIYGKTVTEPLRVGGQLKSHKSKKTHFLVKYGVKLISIGYSQRTSKL